MTFDPTKPVFKTEITRVIDYNDFDELINHHFGRNDYECVAEEEWGNYESHAEDDADGKIDKWNEESLEKFKKGERTSISYRTLLNDLVRRKIIPPGAYRIDIFW